MNYFCCNDVASESLSLSGIPPKKAARTFLSCGWHCGTPWNTHSSDKFAYSDPVGQHREEYNNMNKLASNTLGVWLGIRELINAFGLRGALHWSNLKCSKFHPASPGYKTWSKYYYSLTWKKTKARSVPNEFLTKLEVCSLLVLEHSWAFFKLRGGTWAVWQISISLLNITWHGAMFVWTDLRSSLHCWI